MESPIILQTNRLKLYYGAFEALKGIDMQIPEKQITAFIGPSGCGKSTFLKTLNRMNDLVPGVRIEGEVLYNGRDIFSKEVDVTWLRKKIGMVFQKPNPFPMSIYDNIAYGPRLHGPGPFRRPAAAHVHRARAGCGAGRAADGRTHQRAGPGFHHAH